VQSSGRKRKKGREGTKSINRKKKGSSLIIQTWVGVSTLGNEQAVKVIHQKVKGIGHVQIIKSYYTLSEGPPESLNK